MCRLCGSDHIQRIQLKSLLFIKTEYFHFFSPQKFRCSPCYYRASSVSSSGPLSKICTRSCKIPTKHHTLSFHIDCKGNRTNLETSSRKQSQNHPKSMTSTVKIWQFLFEEFSGRGTHAAIEKRDNQKYNVSIFSLIKHVWKYATFSKLKIDQLNKHYMTLEYSLSIHFPWWLQRFFVHARLQQLMFCYGLKFFTIILTVLHT